MKGRTGQAQNLKHKLDRLECPFTESAEETWVMELVFTPGEPRLRILQWLLSRFHKKIYDRLDPVHTSARSETRLRAMLFIASSVGLCRKDDLELIEGKVGGKKQAKFMDKLLDLVLEVDAAEDTRWQNSPGKYGNRSDLTSQAERDADLVDSIVLSQPIEELFPPTLRLLPVDIHRSLELIQTGSAIEKTDLTERLELLTQDLLRQGQLFRELQLEHKYFICDEKSRENVTRKFGLCLSELQQTIVSFNYCYEHNIQQWCRREFPEISPVGDRIVAVNRILNNFVSTLGAMKIIKASAENIEKTTSPKEAGSAGLLVNDELLSKISTMASTIQTSIKTMEQTTSLIDI